MGIFTVKKPFFTNGHRVGLINRKSVDLLRRYTTRFAKIKPRKYGNISVRHQKMVRTAILRARELGLMPYKK